MHNLQVPTCISEESWEAFIELRRRKGTRAPLTDYAARMVCKKLIDADRQGYDAQHMMDEAIENGWTTVWVTGRTPKVNRAAEQTQSLLKSMGMTAAEKAASDEARKRVMSAIRRVA